MASVRSSLNPIRYNSGTELPYALLHYHSAQLSHEKLNTRSVQTKRFRFIVYPSRKVKRNLCGNTGCRRLYSGSQKSWPLLSWVAYGSRGMILVTHCTSNLFTKIPHQKRGHYFRQVENFSRRVAVPRQTSDKGTRFSSTPSSNMLRACPCPTRSSTIFEQKKNTQKIIVPLPTSTP